MEHIKDYYYDLFLNLLAFKYLIKNNESFAYEYQKYLIREVGKITQSKKEKEISFLDEETEEFLSLVELENNLGNMLVLQKRFSLEIKQALGLEL